MITVGEALDIIMAHKIDYGVEPVAIDQADGCILAEDIYCDRAMPPFHRVTMDGIAISYAAYQSGRRTFRKEKTVAAGEPQRTLEDASSCIEIMTGAVCPIGADTIIRYEDLEENEDGFTILVDVKQKQNIHFKGSDHQQDEILLKAGKKLSPIDIGVLATVGKAIVSVRKMPTALIVSSGDELVEVDVVPEAHQIRKSNVLVMEAILNDMGVRTRLLHLPDEPDEIYRKLKNELEEIDVLMMAGGVSKGKFDFIPQVLEELGVEKKFHRVRQRPGKPFWFGIKEEKTVFAFPGNPVSSFACFHRYFVPWIKMCLGQDPGNFIPVKLKSEVHFKPDLEYFAQAKLLVDSDGQLLGEVGHGNGSGDLVNPTKMNGFIILPRGKETFLAGEVYNFIPYKRIVY